MSKKPHAATGEFSAALHQQFAVRIDRLQDARRKAQMRIDEGALPAFPNATGDARDAGWRVGANASPDDAGPRLTLESALSCAEVAPHVELRQLHTRDEAALWRELFGFIEERCAAAPGTTRITLVIDTIQAAFELEGILYELRDRVAALRWDGERYLLSFIRTFHTYPEFVLPDRDELAIGAPFLRALGKHALRVGEQRGVDVTGFPAPPTDSPNPVEGADLLQIHIGKITEQGVRENLDLALQYVAAGETGDARAELALAQLWQWTHHATGVLDAGQKVDGAMLESFIGGQADGEAANRLLQWLRNPDAVSARVPV